MFKRTAVVGLIPALIVSAVVMVALTIPAGAARATVVSSCDGGPYGRVTVNISASPGQPSNAGTPITLSATSTGCSNPEYRFFLQPPGSAWGAVTPYGGATYNWTTTNARDGIWGIGVWVRQIGSTVKYAAYSIATYRIVNKCTSAGISASPGSPSTKGTIVALSGSSTTCAAPQYKFWVLIKTRWVAFGPYSSSATKNWNTGSYEFKKGRNMVGVWVRQLGSAHYYDSYAIISYYLT